MTIGQRLWWLILGRVAAVVLLLLGGALWTRGTFGSSVAISLRTVAPIVFAVVTLTVIYCAARLFSKAYVAQARVQFFFDVLIVTWLIWTTGNAGSPYSALYIVVISIASLFVGPRGAMITSVGSAAAFTACAIAALAGFDSSAPHVSADIARTVQIVGLSDVSFLLVGLLAARLAERQSRSDVELAVATQSLASLRALHERIVESIRSGLITTDLDGHIYSFNSAAAEITGFQAADVRGKDVSIFFGDMTRQIRDSMRAASDGHASPRFEADCLTPDGLLLRLGFTVAPLFAETGETTGLVVTFQDLTEIRALEDTARRQDRLAAVGRLAASIAHEIRNPLAAMRGSIQMLHAEMEPKSEHAQLMEIILRESDRLNKIVTDYLAYARPRKTDMKDADPCALLQDTFKLLSNSSEVNKDHKLELDLPTERVIVKGDPEQLRQVFWNIARNALTSMSGGGTLRASVEIAGPDRVRLSISDTGCGMSAEQVERLFEPFSSSTGGTGLGLSIVYQIIRDHSGTINVLSREGEGTTITIELPVGS